MLIQFWTIDITESRWLANARLGCLLLLATCAGCILAFVTGTLGVSGWWGDWLWPWPVLLYVTWVVTMSPAPLLEPAQQLTLTASGELGDRLICHSLRTPWLVALSLRQPAPDRAHYQVSTAPDCEWVWVLRDQLSVTHWTRLNRVCQSVLDSKTQIT